MGHLHSASGCLCCEGMGISVNPQELLRQTGRQQVQERLSTQGLDHIYSEHVEVTIEAEVAREPAQPVQDLGDLSSLVRQQAERLMDQGHRLEAATYRIGYLEAQLHQKDQELKLLTVSRQGKWFRSFTSWFLRVD